MVPVQSWKRTLNEDRLYHKSSVFEILSCFYAKTFNKFDFLEFFKLGGPSQDNISICGEIQFYLKRILKHFSEKFKIIRNLAISLRVIVVHKRI